MKFLAAPDAAQPLQRPLLHLPPLLHGKPLLLLPEQGEALLLLRRQRRDRLAAEGERHRSRDAGPCRHDDYAPPLPWRLRLGLLGQAAPMLFVVLLLLAETGGILFLLAAQLHFLLVLAALVFRRAAEVFVVLPPQALGLLLLLTADGLLLLSRRLLRDFVLALLFLTLLLFIAALHVVVVGAREWPKQGQPDQHGHDPDTLRTMSHDGHSG